MVTASDTLHRHEASHHTTGEGGIDRTHRITVKTFRACFSCAAARVRCSGGTPCGRCQTRSLECQYPTKRRSKAKLRSETIRRSSSTELHKQELQNIQASLSQLNTNHVVSRQTTSASASGMSESQSVPNGRPDFKGAQLASQNEGPSAGSPAVRPYGGSPGAGPVTGSTGPDHLQPYIATSNLNLDLASSGVEPVTEATLNFGQASFDHAMLSTLNWLPDEFLAVTSNGEPQHGFQSCWAQSGVSNNHEARMPWGLPSIQNDQATPSISESVSLMSPGHLSLGAGFRSPRQYSHITGETSAQGKQVDPEKRVPDYYVNKDDSHFPDTVRSPVPWSMWRVDAGSGQPADECHAHQFAFPNVHMPHIENVPEDVVQSVRLIESPTHNEIYHQFLSLCRKDNPFFSKFESESFPSVDDCNRYLVCYFRSFQAIYPIVHTPSFDPNRCHWILTLAIVAIGCHYSKIRETRQCTAAFHELIRRAIIREVGSSVVISRTPLILPQKEKSRHIRPSIEMIQAMLFNCIGLLHVEDEGSRLAARGMFKDLVTLSSRGDLLASSPKTSLRGPSEEPKWMAWIQDEIRRRTGYCIWVCSSLL